LKSQTIQWLEPQPIHLPADLLATVDGERILAEALFRREIRSKAQAEAFLDPKKYRPALPSDLPNLEKAVERIATAIKQGEKIGIWGDFDVDGQTATAVLFLTLRSLGGSVSYYIPVPAHETRWITIPGWRNFMNSGVQLLVTCDTGISANEAVEFAADQGVDCLITDHHTPPANLPTAYAIVNPHFLSADHPLNPLCGVGCAYKLAEGLFQHYGRREEADQLLDLVALGTIADVAKLTGDNRFLVQKGLDLIHRRPRPSLQAILELSKINYTQLTEEHVSYIVAPRLNALGRLSDANQAVQFLLCENIEEARPLALSMEATNNQRRLMCDQVFQAAQAQIEQDPNLLNKPALVLDHPNWPSGVIGIAASRLVEAYKKPVILISCPPGEIARASARSVVGINITAILAEVQELLLAFGGHAMAAGFSIDPEKIPQFKQTINRILSSIPAEQFPVQQLAIDAYLPLDRLSMDLVEMLDRLSPFGAGNPPLVLATRNLALRSFSPIGKNEEHLQLVVEDPSGVARRIIWWQGAGFSLPEGRFDLAYSVRASNYRGERSIQVEWINARPIENELVVRRRFANIQAQDLRGTPDLINSLEEIKRSGSSIIWQEGQKIEGVAGVDRYHLEIAETLVIWNIPPGLSELNQMLETVKPLRVAFFGLNSANDLLAGFLKQLAGLVRFVINKRKGEVSITELAAATAQREATIRKGIAWWIAHGDLVQIAGDSVIYTLRQGGSVDPVALMKVESELDELLRETSAFRSYFLRAEIDQLLA
jgi:single-stranded-DNA-specific exonuclease